MAKTVGGWWPRAGRRPCRGSRRHPGAGTRRDRRALGRSRQRAGGPADVSAFMNTRGLEMLVWLSLQKCEQIQKFNDAIQPAQFRLSDACFVTCFLSNESES